MDPDVKADEITSDDIIQPDPPSDPITDSEAPPAANAKEPRPLPVDAEAPRPDQDFPDPASATPEPSGAEPESPVKTGDTGASFSPELKAPDRWDRSHKEAFERLLSMEGGKGIAENWLKMYSDRMAYETPLEQERADLRRFAEPIQNVLEDYRPLIQASGVSADQMIRQSLGLLVSLKQDFAGTVNNLVRQAGTTFEELNSEAPFVDPRTQALEDRLARIERNSSEREKSWNEERAQAIAAQTQAQLKSFIDATDDHGNPKYPHLNQVADDMAELIWGREAQRQQNPSLPTLELEDAYNRAVRMRPELTESQVEAERRRKDNEEAARLHREAQLATGASRRVTGGVPGKDLPSGSLDDELERQFDKTATA